MKIFTIIKIIETFFALPLEICKQSHTLRIASAFLQFINIKRTQWTQVALYFKLFNEAKYLCEETIFSKLLFLIFREFSVFIEFI